MPLYFPSHYHTHKCRSLQDLKDQLNTEKTEFIRFLITCHLGVFYFKTLCEKKKAFKKNDNKIVHQTTYNSCSIFYVNEIS